MENSGHMLKPVLENYPSPTSPFPAGLSVHYAKMVRLKFPTE